MMKNSQIQSEQARANEPVVVETAAAEEEILACQGFSDDEITSLLWLRRWYQHGGSDRVEIVRHLEVLKQQIQQGQLDR